MMDGWMHEWMRGRMDGWWDEDGTTLQWVNICALQLLITHMQPQPSLLFQGQKLK